MEWRTEGREVQAEIPGTRNDGYAERNTDDGCRNNGNKQATRHFQRREHNGEQNREKRHDAHRRGKVANCDKRRIAVRDDAAALQADKRDEQADADTDGQA